MNDPITWQTVTSRQFEYLLRAASLTVQDFMPYGSPVEMRKGYRKISHIKVMRAMMNTDLRTAKEAVDLAIKLWENEYPQAKPYKNDEALTALREKLIGIDSQFD